MEIHESDLQEENDSSRLWHLLALFVAAVGFCVALYGIYHHRLVSAFGESGAACNINAKINCDAVEASAYSHFLTIPWSVWGAAYFFTVLLLLTFSLKRLGNRQEHLLAYTLCVVAGLIV